MQKLSAIASIVINVGEACETHDLKREDLPVRLQIILESLCMYVIQYGILLWSDHRVVSYAVSRVRSKSARRSGASKEFFNAGRYFEASNNLTARYQPHYKVSRLVLRFISGCFLSTYLSGGECRAGCPLCANQPGVWGSFLPDQHVM